MSSVEDQGDSVIEPLEAGLVQLPARNGQGEGQGQAAGRRLQRQDAGDNHQGHHGVDQHRVEGECQSALRHAGDFERQRDPLRSDDLAHAQGLSDRRQAHGSFPPG